MMDKQDTSSLLALFRQMYLIRRFEEASAEAYRQGHVRGFLHLYTGQEATAVGVLSAVRPEDYIVTHYRDHGHALARGLDVNRTMAELFGKRTGLSKGKGGSMHLFDVSKRFMGGHAIVGGQFPLALGTALAQQYLQESGITVIFFGDGAINQGTFHESMNIAAVWKLPILFLLENNGFGMGSAIERVRAGGDVFYTGAGTYGMEASWVDGMDVLAVKKSSEEAAKYVRAGNGPFFLEAKTYRFQGHSIADGQKYRNNADVARWQERDPIYRFPQLLIEHGMVDEDDISRIKGEVEEIIAASVEFAQESSAPDPSELADDILARE